VRPRPTGGKQLVIDLLRNGKVRLAGDVNVPDLAPAEPEHSGRRDLESTLAEAAGKRHFADAWPSQNFTLDLLEKLFGHC
jgi:hypothetical protein